MQESASIWSNWIQLGFAGFSLILLAVIVWLTSRLLRVLGDSNKVVSGNTEAITLLTASASETKTLMIEMKDSLLSRPCLLPEDVRDKIVKMMRQ
jgi:hypothetical protein